MLTNEQIANHLLDDMVSYKEDVKALILSRLMDSTNSKVYWDAFFRGAEDEDLEAASKGVVFEGKKELITSDLVDLFDRVGISSPSNFDTILDFVYEDVEVAADPTKWTSEDVAIAFRRWVEKQQDGNI